MLQVLGFDPPKSRRISMSNWAAWTLSSQQIQYAALDALITGAAFRGLRLWHASPSSCTSCGHVLGAVRLLLEDQSVILPWCLLRCLLRCIVGGQAP